MSSVILSKNIDLFKNLDDAEILSLLEASYKYYSKEKINEKSFKKINELKRQFSVFYRFFRSLNYTKKNEEEIVKELFKNRNEIINSFSEKINSIYDIQSKRIMFSENKIFPLPVVSEEAKFINVISNIKAFKSFSWKINVTISNNNSIRVLLPEIIFNLTLLDGKTYSFRVDVKLFQELRKSIAFHIKKIMDNENIVFLK